MHQVSHLVHAAMQRFLAALTPSQGKPTHCLSLIHRARMLFIGTLSLLVLAACVEQNEPLNELEQIVAENVITVGTVYGRNTFYYGQEGPTGFEYELSRGFAEYLGVELELLPFYSYEELIQELAQQRIDLIASAMPISGSSGYQFKYGPVYQTLNLVVVYQKPSPPPSSLLDISNKLHIFAHDRYRAPLLRLKEQEPSFQWIETDERDLEELLELVAAGDIPYTLVDSTVLSVVQRRLTNIGVAFSVVSNQQNAWALTPSDDDSVQYALLDYFQGLQATNQLAALEDKYFGHVQSFDFVDTRAFVRAAESTLAQYKNWFMKYAGDVDWRLIAAMSYQESHWDPKAVSATGVRGMMMLTQVTAEEVGVQKRTDPEQSIRGGAQYFGSLLRRIPARVQEPDRVWMALAAYNIGYGHLEDARRIAKALGHNPDLWVDVKKHLPLLEQRRYYRFTRYGYARGREAVNYVENIRRYYDTLKWLEEKEVNYDTKTSTH